MSHIDLSYQFLCQDQQKWSSIICPYEQRQSSFSKLRQVQNMTDKIKNQSQEDKTLSKFNGIRLNSWGQIQQEEPENEKKRYQDKQQFQQQKHENSSENKKKNGYFKWSSSQRKQYWLAYANFILNKQNKRISWGNHKFDGIFKRMQLKVNQKNKIQIKTFDNRMKNFYYLEKRMDILQATCKALKDYQLNEQEKDLVDRLQVLNGYENSQFQFQKHTLKKLHQLLRILSP